MRPFLTVLTPTYHRPAGLAACMASVRTQTAVDRIEQVVMVDHVGVGVGGMFASVPRYAPLVRGEYVTFLCDDDRFADPRAVERLELAVRASALTPALVLVQTIKANHRWPASHDWPPVIGTIDLNCSVVRGDIWHMFCGAYGQRYEGDYDHLAAMAAAGVSPAWFELLLSVGAVSRGEAAA